MWIALMAVGSLLGLISLGCVVLVAIRAYKKDGLVPAILAFFLWPYTLYYAFAKYEGRKVLVITGLLVGVLGAYLAGNATALVATEEIPEQQEAQDIIDDFDAPLDEGDW